MTFPLLFKVFKPRTRLKPGDTYETKPATLGGDDPGVAELGLPLPGRTGRQLVWGEQRFCQPTGAVASEVRGGNPFQSWRLVAERLNACATRDFRPFERIFSNGKQHTRFIREMVFGQRGHIRYYHLTTDPHTLPNARTWYIMTNLEGNIRKTVGNTYGLRTWIAYGFQPTQARQK
jgi:SRSO17 transposase